MLTSFCLIDTKREKERASERAGESGIQLFMIEFRAYVLVLGYISGDFQKGFSHKTAVFQHFHYFPLKISTSAASAAHFCFPAA